MAKTATKKLLGHVWYQAKPEIPLDMLRYDVAFVPAANPLNLVCFVTWSTSRWGRHEGTPTHARWRSFGVNLSAISDEPEWDPTKLITYQHPQGNHNTYEPITLAEFLKEG